MSKSLKCITKIKSKQQRKALVNNNKKKLSAPTVEPKGEKIQPRENKYQLRKSDINTQTASQSVNPKRSASIAELPQKRSTSAR